MQPNFLVIGAMKSATTTLYHDLAQNPNVCCAEKEAGVYLQDSTSFQLEGLDSSKASAIGEICTSYSMYPDIQGVAERVRNALGSEVRIVYLVRNPIQRTLSHHQHFYNWHGAGQMGPDINLELNNHPQLINYSKYAMQLEPWVEQFGLSKLHVIQFENYIANRLSCLEKLCNFLDVPVQFGTLQEEGANRGDDRRVAGTTMLKFYHTKMFQRWLRPLTRGPVRWLVRSVFLHRARKVSIAPTRETLNRIRDAVLPDTMQLQQLLGFSQPMWNLDQTIDKILDRDASKVVQSR
ncbi:MAG: sulfotransferase [Pirellulales bacterium]